LKKSGKISSDSILDNPILENMDSAEQRNLPSFSALIGKGQNRKHTGFFDGSRPKRQHSGFGSLPGSGRKDFPSLSSIPITEFSCLDGPGGSSSRDAGFYADKETKCQVSFDVTDVVHFISCCCGC
jgi:hypothetical protein